MKYTRAYIDAIGYELAPVVVTTAELEARLKPLYDALRIAPGQLEALTGIHERRWWRPGFKVADGAIAAARKVLAASSVRSSDIGVLIYSAVCREDFEPATACRVADAVGVNSEAAVYDVANACLGTMNGIMDVANRIELGQVRAGLVVGSETAREINEITIEQLVNDGSMDLFATSLATLTGGSGGVAILLTDGSFSDGGRHRLLGGVSRTAPEHHALCRWGVTSDESGRVFRQYATTNAPAVLKYGVELGVQTWRSFLQELGWTTEAVDKIICHQVGGGHQEAILKAIGVPREKDYPTYPFLGNIGTVSLPLTAALADERGFLDPGDRVGFLGIGSGLNCLMLGLEW